MRTIFILLALCHSLLGKADGSKARILIFGKTIRPAHSLIIPVAGSALVDLLSKNGFQASFNQDSGVFERSDLNGFQVLVFLDVSEGVISPNQKQAIEIFFERGGGIVAIHASIAAGKDWPWFQGLLGTSFVDHAPIQPGIVRVTASTYPSNESLPPHWSQSDEWYNFSSQVVPPAKVLATADETTYKGGKMGASHPMNWSYDLGKGRFWYTGLGHSASLYTDLEGVFPKMLLQAVRWTSKQNN
jgi:type 1 glutamine amidotransferase